jgi:hypothetical protein
MSNVALFHPFDYKFFGEAKAFPLDRFLDLKFGVVQFSNSLLELNKNLPGFKNLAGLVSGFMTIP